MKRSVVSRVGRGLGGDWADKIAALAGPDGFAAKFFQGGEEDETKCSESRKRCSPDPGTRELRVKVTSDAPELFYNMLVRFEGGRTRLATILRGQNTHIFAWQNGEDVYNNFSESGYYAPRPMARRGEHSARRRIPVIRRWSITEDSDRARRVAVRRLCELRIPLTKPGWMIWKSRRSTASPLSNE